MPNRQPVWIAQAIERGKSCGTLVGAARPVNKEPPGRDAESF